MVTIKADIRLSKCHVQHSTSLGHALGDLQLCDSSNCTKQLSMHFLQAGTKSQGTSLKGSSSAVVDVLFRSSGAAFASHPKATLVFRYMTYRDLASARHSCDLITPVSNE